MPTVADRNLLQRQKRDHLEWMQTHRFIEEVHRLEADGRVESRADLERRLLLPVRGITVMRSGKVRVPSSAIELLKREYNGDWQYILLGLHDYEASGPYPGGRNLRVHKGYAFRYQSTGVNLMTRAGLPVADEPASSPYHKLWQPDTSTTGPKADLVAYAQLLDDLRQIMRQELDATAPPAG